MQVVKNKYILVDLDGTIVDTDIANYLSYKEAVQKVMNINLDLFYKINTRFTREKLQLIFPDLRIEDLGKIIKIKTKIFERYLKYTRLKVKFVKIIKKLSKFNTIVLATNSHKIKANLILEYYHLFNIFDKKYYNENYIYLENNKYKYILNNLNMQPSNIIVFEDSLEEIKKATALLIPYKNIINTNICGEKSYE